MKKKSKGFTLIELLAVIVILAVIALIAMPIVLNLIEKARKGSAVDSAYGLRKSAQLYYSTGLIDSPSGIPLTEFNCDGENCISSIKDSNGEFIKLDIDGTIPTSGKITVKPNGEIIYEDIVFNNKYECIIESTNPITCDGNVSDTRLDGSIKLDSTSGSYTYPETKTFEVIENLSGGTLTCTSSDEKVATCSITDNTVTVVAGTKGGVATLTIKSAGNTEYKDAKAAYVVTTELATLTSVTALDYEGVYDGLSHGIEVTSEGSTIKYGLTEGVYTLTESPKYIDAGEYTIYYQVKKEGYETVTGSKKVIITKIDGKVELDTVSTIKYNETNIIEIKENLSGGEITVVSTNPSIIEAVVNSGKIEIIGKQIGTTSITVSSEETTNYNKASVTYEIIVKEAENTLELSSTSGNYTYPETRDIEVKVNTSEGKLSCTSSDDAVATCTITETTLTVVAGTKEGLATLTIKSEATENYKEATVAYLATTLKGTLTTINADGYSGVYDGKEHGITVTCEGATITYGTEENNYNLTESPKYIEAGEYTVYYKIEKTGYNTVKDSKKVIINKATGNIILSEESGEVNTGQTMTFTVSDATGSISCDSDDTSLATCSVSGNTVTVTGIAEGEVTLTVNSLESTNYNAVSKIYSVIVKTEIFSSKVKLGDYVLMTPTQTTYTISGEMTGYKDTSTGEYIDQTINPSELNLWRVININGDGTIDLVSEYVSSTDVYFEGQEGYLKYVGTLNTIAKQYSNSKYVESTRHMGYNGQTLTITDITKFTTTAPWTFDTINNVNETVGGGDILYEDDIELVNDALGTLGVLNTDGNVKNYWLASRYYDYTSKIRYDWKGRAILSYSEERAELTNYNLYWWNTSWRSNQQNLSIRPIITLKSDITSYTGAGTSGSPWLLS